MGGRMRASAPTNARKQGVGAHIVRPGSLMARAICPGGYGIRPYSVGVDACIDPRIWRQRRILRANTVRPYSPLLVYHYNPLL